MSGLSYLPDLIFVIIVTIAMINGWRYPKEHKGIGMIYVMWFLVSYGDIVLRVTTVISQRRGWTLFIFWITPITPTVRETQASRQSRVRAESGCGLCLEYTLIWVVTSPELDCIFQGKTMEDTRGQAEVQRCQLLLLIYPSVWLCRSRQSTGMFWGQVEGT